MPVTDQKQYGDLTVWFGTAGLAPSSLANLGMLQSLSKKSSPQVNVKATDEKGIAISQVVSVAQDTTYDCTFLVKKGTGGTWTEPTSGDTIQIAGITGVITNVSPTFTAGDFAKISVTVEITGSIDYSSVQTI